jgi:hypothetical protein
MTIQLLYIPSLAINIVLKKKNFFHCKEHFDGSNEYYTKRHVIGIGDRALFDSRRFITFTVC